MLQMQTTNIFFKRILTQFKDFMWKNSADITLFSQKLHFSASKFYLIFLRHEARSDSDETSLKTPPPWHFTQPAGFVCIWLRR